MQGTSHFRLCLQPTLCRAGRWGQEEQAQWCRDPARCNASDNRLLPAGSAVPSGSGSGGGGVSEGGTGFPAVVTGIRSGPTSCPGVSDALSAKSPLVSLGVTCSSCSRGLRQGQCPQPASLLAPCIRTQSRGLWRGYSLHSSTDQADRLRKHHGRRPWLRETTSGAHNLKIRGQGKGRPRHCPAHTDPRTGMARCAPGSGLCPATDLQSCFPGRDAKPGGLMDNIKTSALHRVTAGAGKSHGLSKEVGEK